MQPGDEYLPGLVQGGRVCVLSVCVQAGRGFLWLFFFFFLDINCDGGNYNNAGNAAWKYLDVCCYWKFVSVALYLMLKMLLI